MKNSFQPKSKSFKNTFCVFQEVLPEEIDGLELQYDSKSKSKYFYTQKGMFRLSNHWGRLANSKWRLVPLEPETTSKFKIGFASWESFHPDNADEKLYFLEVDYQKKMVHYQHKNNLKSDKKPIIRTSFETAKKIKQIRNLFELTSWAKYFNFQDIDELRKQIIDQLIYTNLTLDEIKKAIYGTK